MSPKCAHIIPHSIASSPVTFRAFLRTVARAWDRAAHYRRARVPGVPLLVKIDVFAGGYRAPKAVDERLRLLAVAADVPTAVAVEIRQ